MTDKLLTMEEAAERLNTTPRHVRRLVFERRTCRGVVRSRSAASSMVNSLSVIACCSCSCRHRS